MTDLRLRTFLALFGATILIYFLDGMAFLNPLKSIVQTVTMPIQYSVYTSSQSAQDIFSFLTFWRSGEARIKNLEQRNAELLAAKNEADALRKENNELRAQLGVKPLAEHQLLPAIVLGNGRYLEVGVGINDGVTPGQTVIYLNNLVGSIVKVTPKTSFVQLPTDPQAKIPAKINQARGLIIGQFNSSMMLDRVAQTEDIAQNDLVLTSGEGGTFPPDLVVGKLGKIESAETDLFQKGEVVPAVDYQNLTTVFVIMD
ncbi:rod shape-determining protein MreC [Patescibacteria group bacterium]|nr:rod shape-determining protein MreC [Patescibacteria group bacterium]